MEDEYLPTCLRKNFSNNYQPNEYITANIPCSGTTWIERIENSKYLCKDNNKLMFTFHKIDDFECAHNIKVECALCIRLNGVDQFWKDTGDGMESGYYPIEEFYDMDKDQYSFEFTIIEGRCGYGKHIPFVNVIDDLYLLLGPNPNVQLWLKHNVDMPDDEFRMKIWIE